MITKNPNFRLVVDFTAPDVESALRFKKKVVNSMQLDDGIYECDVTLEEKEYL